MTESSSNDKTSPLPSVQDRENPMSWLQKSNPEMVRTDSEQDTDGMSLAEEMDRDNAFMDNNLKNTKHEHPESWAANENIQLDQNIPPRHLQKKDKNS
jgi:hypothetical protein